MHIILTFIIWGAIISISLFLFQLAFSILMVAIGLIGSFFVLLATKIAGLFKSDKNNGDWTV